MSLVPYIMRDRAMEYAYRRPQAQYYNFNGISRLPYGLQNTQGNTGPNKWHYAVPVHSDGTLEVYDPHLKQHVKCRPVGYDADIFLEIQQPGRMTHAPPRVYQFSRQSHDVVSIYDPRLYLELENAPESGYRSNDLGQRDQAETANKRFLKSFEQLRDDSKQHDRHYRLPKGQSNLYCRLMKLREECESLDQVLKEFEEAAARVARNEAKEQQKASGGTNSQNDRSKAAGQDTRHDEDTYARMADMLFRASLNRGSRG